MFGKCLKHEFRATARQLVPLFIAMPAVAILAGLFLGLGTRLPENEDSMVLSSIGGLLTGLLIFALVALMIAVSVVAFVMIIRRFYVSFFTDEGYLSFTLPVTVNDHIFSKFVTAYVWQVAAVAVSLVSILLMSVVGLVSGGTAFDLADVDMAEVESVFDAFFHALGMEAGEGFLPAAIALFLLNIIVALAASILMLYFAVSLASMLAKKHRVIVGILCYYLINMVFFHSLSNDPRRARFGDGGCLCGAPHQLCHLLRYLRRAGDPLLSRHQMGAFQKAESGLTSIKIQNKTAPFA